MNEVASSFEYILKNVRPWLRPFAAIGWGLLYVTMLVVMLPVLVVRAVMGRDPDPIELLRAEVETTWKTTSPQAAVEIARNVHRQLRARMKKSMWTRGVFRPWGKMGFREFYTLSWYLYHWQMQIGDLDGAIETCEGILPPAARTEQVFEDWAIMKARALARQSGNGAAIAYLAEILRQVQPLPRIEEYLLSLRRDEQPS